MSTSTRGIQFRSVWKWFIRHDCRLNIMDCAQTQWIFKHFSKYTKSMNIQMKKVKTHILKLCINRNGMWAAWVGGLDWTCKISLEIRLESLCWIHYDKQQQPKSKSRRLSRREKDIRKSECMHVTSYVCQANKDKGSCGVDASLSLSAVI